MQAVNVSASGRLTALMSTYDSEQCAEPSPQTPAGARYAVLSAAPGATSLTVIASVPAAVAAAIPGGVQDTGVFTVSPDAGTFVLCSFPRFGARSAQLIDVMSGNQLSVRRATTTTSSRVDQVQCAASNSGAAMMTVLAKASQLYLVSLVGGTRPNVVHHRIDDLLNFSMSPSGREAFAQETMSGRPVLINLSNARITPLAIPPGWRRGCCGGSAISSSEHSFEPDNEFGSFAASSAAGGLFPWVTPDEIIANPGNREMLLNPRADRWYVGPRGLSFATYCPLPSGLLLLAKGTEGTSSTTYTLYLFNPVTAHLAVISTDQLGVIHGISCGANGDTVFASVGQFPATLYAASGAGIDGSAWTK